MAKKRVKNGGKPASDGNGEGLWIDTALLARLYGRRSPLSAPVLTTEAQRLLHYADVVLGTDKKERFEPAKVHKIREK